MNFLAHAYLSFSEEQIVGNLIGDFVKNRDRERLSLGIQQGVLLHRAIDTFTDAHPKVKEAKTIFQSLVRLYSGAFVDVVFDYFLANDTFIKTESEWKSFSQNVYQTLHQYYEILPENFKPLVARMEKDDWLFNYRYDWGIDFSIRNVKNKAQYLEKDLPVFEIFLENKSFLKSCYDDFFSDLFSHCKSLNETFQKF